MKSADMCGEMIRFGVVHNGWSGGSGSWLKTWSTARAGGAVGRPGSAWACRSRLEGRRPGLGEHEEHPEHGGGDGPVDDAAGVRDDPLAGEQLGKHARVDAGGGEMDSAQPVRTRPG